VSQPTARDYFTEQQPLSPISADKIHPAVFGDLFDTRNLIYPELESRPSLIIGRRGAGKTAFLNSLALDHSAQVTVNLPAQVAFRNIVLSIEKFANGGPVFVEEVADLWNVLLWVAVFAQLLQDAPLIQEKDELDTLDPVHVYLAGLRVKAG
jgi:predicted NACHT family NTPase